MGYLEAFKMPERMTRKLSARSRMGSWLPQVAFDVRPQHFAMHPVHFQYRVGSSTPHEMPGLLIVEGHEHG